MWIDDIPAGHGWTHLWSGRVRCWECEGIRSIDAACPACGGARHHGAWTTLEIDGTAHAFPPTFMGAEGRIEDYLFLQLMEREWQRSDAAGSGSFQLPSHRALLPLLYWTYFETRIERLVHIGLSGVPEHLASHILGRYPAVFDRMTKLYKLLFGTTYRKDLADVGAASVWTHLEELRERRNAFVHGDPSKFDDAFIVRVVERLRDEHEAWIAVFNKRIAQITVLAEASTK